MKTLLRGLGLGFFALSLGCTESDGPTDAVSTGGKAAAGSGGDTSNTTGGSGANGGAAESSAGQAGASDPNAEAQAEYCARICATEAELPCAGDMTECLQGWCDLSLLTLFPQCLVAYDAMLACMAPEPVESYFCEEDGAFPKEDTCAGEVAALNSCFGA